ncbi:MAG: hypothetical protein KF764_06275 [Labilithrix sp.]|nr:hypothetical protein [Labilithrix sp.]
MNEPRRSPGLALHEWLFRWRFRLFAIVLGHFILAHYFVIGFVSWDGFGHRVPPVVELVQHGSLGLDKYANWALDGFRPFVELANAPFLYLFGLDGLYFAFALALLPFCAVAMFLFTREATHSRNAAFYAAATYVLMPMVNSQVFSGYVDWAIPGLLAFFLYPLIALGRDESAPKWTGYAKVTLATFLYTMARQQAPYLSVFFFGILAGVFFVERRGLRFSLKRRNVLGWMSVAFALGLAPAAIAQLVNYLHHGTPIYPYQFKLLGLTIGEGWTLEFLCHLGGLEEYSPAGFFRASVAAWLVPSTWPYAFFDSRHFGGGLFFITALLTLPITLKATNRPTRVLLAAFIVASIGGKDFWLPRYAYTIVLSLCLCNGIALATLLERKRRWPFYALAGVLSLHALRPEWDVFRIRSGDRYPRMNASNSSLFLDGALDIPVYPDLGADLLIAYAPGNNFILPLYGRKLKNSVITSVPKKDIGERCEGLRPFLEKTPGALVVDDENLTAQCARTCVATSGRCLAYRLDPE